MYLFYKCLKKSNIANRMVNSSRHTLLLRVIFSSLCLVFLYTLTLRIVFLLSYLPETGGSSIDVLYGIMRILKGRNLYNNPELPPYPVIQFMPLYYYVVAGVSQILEISQNLHAVSVVNRMCSLGFNLFIFIPVHRILKKIFECHETIIHWIAFMVIFILIPAADFAGVGSLCLLAMTFAIYYFLCFLNLYDYKYGSELVLTGIATALAVFIDQVALFLFAGILSFLLFHVKDKKAALLFLISYAIAFLFLFMILVGNNTPYWFLNVIYGIRSSFNLYFLSNIGKLPIFTYAYILFMLLLAVAFLFMKQLDKRLKFLRFIALWNLLFLLFEVFTAGSHQITYSLVFVMVIVIAFIELQEKYLLSSMIKLALTVMAFFLILNLTIEKNWLLLKDLKGAKSDYTDCSIAATYVKHNVKNDEYIFTEFQSQNMLNLMIGEKALYPTYRKVVESAFAEQIFKYNDFTQRVKDGKIKYLIAKKGMKPELFLNVEFEGYEKEATIRGYDVYIYHESR